MKKFSVICLAILSTLLLSNSIFALAPEHPSNNPANVMNTLNQTLPAPQTPGAGEFQTTQNPQYIRHAEAVTNHVILKQVQLVGAKVIPASVQAIFQSRIGQPINLHDVQKMATDLEAAYRAAGYILVRVILPPQEINLDAGIVHFQVINGAIKQIIFIGDNAKAAQQQLHRYAQQIEVQDPVSYHSIDRFLVLANQLPGINVSATIVPDKQITGAADLVVRVIQTSYSAYYNINNRGTQNIGPYQQSIGGTLYDVFGADATSVAASSSMKAIKQLEYGSVSYDIVVDRFATEINPSFTSTKTQPGGDLTALALQGDSTKYNLSINQPLYTSTLHSIELQSALYHVDSKNDLYSGSQLLYHDEITGLTLGGNYRGTLLDFYHDATLSVTQGAPILGTPKSLTDPSVTNGKTSFTHFNLLTSDIHYFTQQLSVALGSQLQYSWNTLVSSEQIGFGGQQFGQAFTPYIISGNSGAMGSVALRYDLPLQWGFKQLQPEIFYDAGAVYYANISGTTNDHATAQSAGVGLNLQWQRYVNASFTVAKPLTITQTPGTSLGWVGFLNVTVMV